MGMRMAEDVLNNLNKPNLLSLTARWILKLDGRRQACSSYQCRPMAYWASFSPLYRYTASMLQSCTERDMVLCFSHCRDAQCAEAYNWCKAPAVICT